MQFCTKAYTKLWCQRSQQLIEKTSITLLQEYCQQRKTQPPSYDTQTVEKDGGGFCSRVTVVGKMYLTWMRLSKKKQNKVQQRRLLSYTLVHLVLMTLRNQVSIWLTFLLYYSGPYKNSQK